MKYFKVFIIIAFAAILITPIIFINLKNDQISLIDNSKLPELNTINDFYSFENYISKRIGFRDNIISLYTKTNDKLFDKMIHPIYIYGTNKYVFFKTEIEKHDNEYLDEFAKYLKDIQSYVENRGSYFLFFINPTKISAYNKYLPQGYNYTNYRINYLKKRMDELKVNYIDNTIHLKEISKKEQIFNKKYDAGHWNDIGAFYGLNNVYNKLISDGFNISKLNIRDYNLTYETVTTLPVSEFKINEKIPNLNLKINNYSFTSNYNDIIKLNKSATYYTETTNSKVNNNYTVLFFRDSYMNRKEKFVSNIFSKVYYVHSYHNAINIDYYYNLTEPDIVLLDAVEYAITDNYYSPFEINNKYFNKSYDSFVSLRNNDFIKLDKQQFIEQIENQKNEKITTIKINDSKINYAYLRINKSKIYDFIYENNERSVTLDTNLFNNSKSIEIILINEKETKKQIIVLK